MPRQSRTKLWGFFVLLAVLAVAGGVSYVGWRQSVSGPSVTGAPPRLIGHTTSFPLTLEARRGNLVGVEVAVVQGTDRVTVARPEGSPGSRVTLPVAFEAAALKLREGDATIEVRARDDFWRPLSPDARAIATFPVRLDLTPPKLEILGATQYVSNGGVGLVAVRVDGAIATEITVGPMVVPTFPTGPPDGGARVALVPLPWDLAPGTPIAVRARDEAGNVATRGIAFEWRPRTFPRDRIEIRDGFLQTKVPELLPQHPPGAPLIEGFLTINREQRRLAEEEKRRVGLKTADRPLWQGAFVQPRNTKVFSNFAETRVYTFQGREVDTQVHFGFDLASTRQAPVPAANTGLVVFAGPLTIYGNTVIIDHGLGLQTLYAHLSSLAVKLGDSVERGQEIGRTGTTGLAIGDHLHYETLVHGISVTPIEWWDPKWIRDRINLPLRTAGLPEIAGLAGGDDEAPARRRSR